MSSGYLYNGTRGVGLSSALYTIATIDYATNWLTFSTDASNTFSKNGISIISPFPLLNNVIALPNSTSIYNIETILNVDSPITGNNTFTFTLWSSVTHNGTYATTGLSYIQYLPNTNQTTYKGKFLYNANQGQYIAINIANTTNISFAAVSVWSRIHINEIGI